MPDGLLSCESEKYFLRVAAAAAVAAVSATLNGFSVFSVPHHASDDQCHDTTEYRQYNKCSHFALLQNPFFKQPFS